MIRRYEINRAVRESFPQFLAILLLANGRRALEFRRALWNLLCGERQIVRAGLDADFGSLVSRVLQHRNGVARG
jgi:hypothetical protein